MIIAAYVVGFLVACVAALTAIVCVHLFTQNKYGSTNRLDILEEQFEAWSNKKQANPVEIHERLVALENRAGIMIGTRR